MLPDYIFDSQSCGGPEASFGCMTFFFTCNNIYKVIQLSPYPSTTYYIESRCHVCKLLLSKTMTYSMMPIPKITLNWLGITAQNFLNCAKFKKKNTNACLVTAPSQTSSRHVLMCMCYSAFHKCTICIVMITPWIRNPGLL